MFKPTSIDFHTVPNPTVTAPADFLSQSKVRWKWWAACTCLCLGLSLSPASADELCPLLGFYIVDLDAEQVPDGQLGRAASREGIVPLGANTILLPYLWPHHYRCEGSSIVGERVRGRDALEWRGDIPPKAVADEINRLQLPELLQGTISSDGRSVVGTAETFWYWWNGDALTKYERYRRGFRLTRLTPHARLIQKDASAIDLDRRKAPIEIEEGRPFVVEIDFPDFDGLQLKRTDIDLFYEFRSDMGKYFASTASTISSLNQTTKKATFKPAKLILVEATMREKYPEEWTELRLQPGESVFLHVAGLSPIELVPKPATRVKTLRFVRQVGERYEPITGDLTYGARFYLEAEFDQEPVEQSKEATLELGPGTPARKVAVYKVEGDARRFRSKPIELRQP
jgi:hypothetical protein